MNSTAARRDGRDWYVAHQRSRFILALCALVVGGGLLNATVAHAQTLHERIDQFLGQANDPLTTGPAEDSIFLRRLSLDLRNSVPTSTEIREFLSDNSPSKKEVWIDKFLSDPLFEERMVSWLDLTLMERRAPKRVDRQKWIDYLRSIVDSSTTIDQWTRDMIIAPWWELDKQPSQRFFLDRDGDPHLVTRDFGRIFLGRDMQCAQCHDHPNIDDYLQQDYQGLLSFFSPSSVQEVPYKDAEGKDQKANLYVERPASESSFESVFDKGKLRLIGAKAPHLISVWDTYLVPRDRVQPTPASAQFGEVTKLPLSSRRKQLAEMITSPTYRPFAENWSNRLWSMMFAKGVVDPVDMHHADNPSTNRQLLALLADGLVELKFDAKNFLSEIARTQAYQRAHWLPFESNPSLLTTVDIATLEKNMNDVTTQIEAISKEEESALKLREESTAMLQSKEAELIVVVNELKAVDAKLAELTKKTNEATVARDSASKLLENERNKVQLLTEATAKLEQVKTLQGKDDPELAMAIQTAVQRRDASIAEVPKLEAALATNQTNLDVSGKSEQELALSALSLAQKVGGFRSDLELLRNQELALRQAWRTKRETVRSLQSEKYYRQNLHDLIALQGDLPKLEMQIAAIDAQVIANNQGVTTAKDAATAAAQTREQASQLREQSATAQKTIQDRVVQLETEIKQLDATRMQLVDASRLVSTAGSLDAAINELSQSAQSRQSNMTQVQLEVQKATEDLTSKDQALVLASQELEKQTLAVQAAQTMLDQATASATMVRRSFEDAQVKLVEKQTSVMEHHWRTASAANLKPLTPEQFCWSLLRVMGHMDSSIANEQVELDKQQPLPVEPPPTQQQLTDRKRIVVRRALDKLRGNTDTFANLFAPGAGQADAFFASAEQALYMSNGGVIHSWSAAGNNNITERIAKATDLSTAAHDLYETILCRKPSDAEIAVVSKSLDCAPEQRGPRAQELVWAILCGVEFRFVQ